MRAHILLEMYQSEITTEKGEAYFCVLGVRDGDDDKEKCGGRAAQKYNDCWFSQRCPIEDIRERIVEWDWDRMYCAW